MPFPSALDWPNVPLEHLCLVGRKQTRPRESDILYADCITEVYYTFLRTKTGFLLTSETNTPPNASAIEEAPTVALHQRLFPGQSRALLVRFKAVDAGEKDGWDTTW